MQLGILLEILVCGLVVDVLPHVTSGLEIAGFGQHLRRHDLHPRMRPGKLGSLVEALRGPEIIVLPEVLNESEREIEMPFVGIVANTFANQRHCGCIISGAAWRRLVEEGRSPFIRDYQIRV